MIEITIKHGHLLGEKTCFFINLLYSEFFIQKWELGGENKNINKFAFAFS
jgi:hypothetical protein